MLWGDIVIFFDFYAKKLMNFHMGRYWNFFKFFHREIDEFPYGEVLRFFRFFSSKNSQISKWWGITIFWNYAFHVLNIQNTSESWKANLPTSKDLLFVEKSFIRRQVRSEQLVRLSTEQNSIRVLVWGDGEGEVCGKSSITRSQNTELFVYYSLANTSHSGHVFTNTWIAYVHTRRTQLES